MDIETLADGIIALLEAEPRESYGDRRVDGYIRERELRAGILDLLQEFDDSRVPTESDLVQSDTEIIELEARNDNLLDEIENLRQRVAELEEEQK